MCLFIRLIVSWQVARLLVDRLLFNRLFFENLLVYGLLDNNY